MVEDLRDFHHAYGEVAIADPGGDNGDKTENPDDLDWVSSLYESIRTLESASEADVHAVTPHVANHNPRMLDWAQPKRQGLRNPPLRRAFLSKRLRAGLVWHPCLEPNHFMPKYRLSPQEARHLVNRDYHSYKSR